MNNTVTKSSIK